MVSNTIKRRISESPNIWPGFVDVLATLLIVIIFVLMVFTVSQIYLSDAISGRDKALQELRMQISELSKILESEIGEKEKTLETLSETESLLSGTQKNLQQQELITEGLQTDLAKKSTEIFVQGQNIFALSDQITDLLSELRIVAKALEVYEGLDSAILDTEGLGEKINKALATRIDQLKTLNTELDVINKKLSTSENDLNDTINELNLVNVKLASNEKILENKITELKIKNDNLLAINESLGIEDGGILEQLNAIKLKNQELENLNIDLIKSQKETEETLKLFEKTNSDLALRDEELQNQINQYQALMNDLLEINDSLGLKDATLKEQLDAIRFKNQELARLNQNLINKDNTIFDLRGKIIELNNILSISDEKTIAQELEIALLKRNIQNIEEIRIEENEISSNQIEQMEIQTSQTFEQISILSEEIENLKNEIVTLNLALEASEKETISKNLEIEILGE